MIKTVALVGTGSHLEDQSNVLNLKQILEKKFKIKIIYNQDCYQKISPAQRADIFFNYCLDNTIDFIWAIRGGEGSADVLPFIHQQINKLKTIKPKPIMGFSDFTVFLNYFSDKLNWPCIHGPCGIYCLDDKLDDLSWEYLENLFKNNRIKNYLNLNGSIIGGNLSLLSISIGDIWEVDFKNKIIIFEDINEKPHVISRTLKYLQRINKFDGCLGIIFGDFSFNQPDLAQPIESVLKNFSETCDFPVYFSTEFGHGPRNLPLLFGAHRDLW